MVNIPFKVQSADINGRDYSVINCIPLYKHIIIRCQFLLYDVGFNVCIPITFNFTFVGMKTI